jgi:hypothetical protein
MDKQERAQMRRVYTIYQPRSDDAGVDHTAAVPRAWPLVGTLLLDTEAQGFDCAGGGGRTPHGFDMLKRLEEQPDLINEPVQVWDDEVWVAVDIGPIEDHEGFREILARVRAANPPHEGPHDSGATGSPLA